MLNCSANRVVHRNSLARAVAVMAPLDLSRPLRVGGCEENLLPRVRVEGRPKKNTASQEQRAALRPWWLKSWMFQGGGWRLDAAKNSLIGSRQRMAAPAGLVRWRMLGLTLRKGEG